MIDASRNKQVDIYKPQRALKQHQREQIDLIKKTFNGLPPTNGLDIGCAKGDFLFALAREMPDTRFTGIEVTPDLIERAKQRSTTIRNAPSFVCADMFSYSPVEPFGLITASGVMGTVEDFRQPLSQWLQWLAPGGKLFIFGRFNSADIDVCIKFRNNYNHSDWQTGMNAYSIKTVGRYLEDAGYAYEFSRFQFDGELPVSEDPVRTYTVKTAEDQVLVVNGANLIAEHYFLTISSSR